MSWKNITIAFALFLAFDISAMMWEDTKNRDVNLFVLAGDNRCFPSSCTFEQFIRAFGEGRFLSFDSSTGGSLPVKLFSSEEGEYPSLKALFNETKIRLATMGYKYIGEKSAMFIDVKQRSYEQSRPGVHRKNLGFFRNIEDTYCFILMAVFFPDKTIRFLTIKKTVSGDCFEYRLSAITDIGTPDTQRIDFLFTGNTETLIEKLGCLIDGLHVRQVTINTFDRDG